MKDKGEVAVDCNKVKTPGELWLWGVDTGEGGNGYRSPLPPPAVGQTDELAAAEAPERISDFMYTLME